MKNLFIYLGDSYAKSGLTDYEWLVDNDLIDINKISLFDFIKNFYRYDNKKSIFSLSQEVKKENSWTNRLSKLLNSNFINLGAYGASWQTVFNQILYAILEYDEKNLIFIITPPINERILTYKINNEIYEKSNMLNFYEIEKENERADFLLNNYSYHYNKNKLNINLDYFMTKENIDMLSSMFNKKIFNLSALQAIINIINLLNIRKYKYFFLPSWYNTVREQITELSEDTLLLNSFIFSFIKNEELEMRSPFLLKEFKTNPFSQHPSFYSQKQIANYYYEYLKNKI